ncbi:SDR family oxidoreductase [Streptomyces misionensis]
MRSLTLRAQPTGRHRSRLANRSREQAVRWIRPAPGSAVAFRSPSAWPHTCCTGPAAWPSRSAAALWALAQRARTTSSRGILEQPVGSVRRKDLLEHCASHPRSFAVAERPRRHDRRPHRRKLGIGLAAGVLTAGGISGAGLQLRNPRSPPRSRNDRPAVGRRRRGGPNQGPRSGVRSRTAARERRPPGRIDTPLWRSRPGLDSDEAIAAAGSTTLLGRFGTAEEAAASALFLMANDYVTGQIITVDGDEILI